MREIIGKENYCNLCTFTDNISICWELLLPQRRFSPVNLVFYVGLFVNLLFNVVCLAVHLRSLKSTVLGTFYCIGDYFPPKITRSCSLST